MNKRILIIAAAVVVLIGAGSLIYSRVSRDPNFMIKHTGQRITEDKAIKSTYDYGNLFYFTDKRTPVFIFTPSEDAEYSFEITNIASDTDDIVVMTVVDKAFSDYVAASNISDEDGSVTDSIADKAFLQKGRRYYVFIDASVGDTGRKKHEGSFIVKVSRSEEELRPEEIREGETVRIRVSAGEQTNLLFVPEETGYYRFIPDIVSSNASTGFSSISGVSAADSDETETVTDGICHLEAGIEYYVQVSVDEITGRSADVDVRCRRIETIVFEEEYDSDGLDESTDGGDDGDKRVRLKAPAMIEYTAAESGKIIFYSESKGDPKVSVYDSEGFLLRSDDDSGAEFGGSKKDFAVMINADRGQEYHIYVRGRFKKCTLHAVAAN